MSQQRTPRYNGAEAWSEQEKQLLKEHCRVGDSVADISEAIGRSEEAVRGMIQKLGLSRRREGVQREHIDGVDEYMKKHGGD